MAWFVVCNQYTTKGELPISLDILCRCLQKICFCCSTQSKDNGKVEAKKDIMIENGQFIKATTITNSEDKRKCNFCNRCKSCQADFDKDKVKTKSKKDVENKCKTLNYFVLFWITIFMLVSNLALWLLMSH